MAVLPMFFYTNIVAPGLKKLSGARSKLQFIYYFAIISDAGNFFFRRTHAPRAARRIGDVEPGKGYKRFWPPAGPSTPFIRLDF